jgi:hypothetical protein
MLLVRVAGLISRLFPRLPRPNPITERHVPPEPWLRPPPKSGGSSLSERAPSSWGPPIAEPWAGLQPELYVDVQNDATAVAVWGRGGEVSPPVVRCSTCGRDKALLGQPADGRCTPACPGWDERPWARP